MDLKLESTSPEQTHALGYKLGKLLRGGDVICLVGDLGAGKTALAKGIGEALDVQEPMTSPTFTFIIEYQAFTQGKPVRLVHMDLYRLNHPEEVEVIGVGENMQEDSICLIEWPEVAEDTLPQDILEVRIEGSGEDKRIITLHSLATQWEERLDGQF